MLWILPFGPQSNDFDGVVETDVDSVESTGLVLQEDNMTTYVV